MTKESSKPLKTNTFLSLRDYGILINTLVLIFGAGVLLYFLQHQFQEVQAIKFNSFWGSMLFYFTLTVLVSKVLFFLFLLYHYRKFKTFKNEYVFITSRLWYFNQYFSINFWRWCSSLFFTTSISRSTSHQIQFFLGKYVILFHPDSFSL